MDGLISVIVPCYNVESYIKRCLDSILNNTYQKLQVICIDDGSSDSTLNVLDSFDDERVVVVSQHNSGVSNARNTGLELAKGQYVSFIDPDDWIHKNYFERLLSLQQRTNAKVVACDFLKTRELCEDVYLDSPKEKEGSFANLYSGLLKDVVWGKLYTRDFIGDSRFISGLSISEDKLFNAHFLLDKSHEKCAFLDAPMYYYFMRDDSAIHTFKGDVLLPVAKEFYKLCESSKSFPLKRYFMNSCLNVAFSARYLSMFRPQFKEYNISCDCFLHDCLSEMDKLSYGILEKVRYSLFIKFPSLYRWFRIATDRTMLEWEKKERLLAFEDKDNI